MNFGHALEALKRGDVVFRKGWNGKGMWLCLVAPTQYTVSTDVVYDDVGEVELLPWVGMATADDKFVPWLASQTDLLAEDWGVA